MRQVAALAVGLVILIGLVLPVQAEASALMLPGDNPVPDPGLEELEAFLEELDRELAETLPGISLVQLFTELKEGKTDFSFGKVLESLASFFGRELLVNSGLLGKLIVLAILASVLQNIQAAFEESTISRLCNAVVFLALISLALTSFHQVTVTGKEAIQQMVNFIYALLPVLITLMAGVGNISTAAITHPVVFASLSLISSLTVNIVFPLIYFAAVLAIVNNISDQFQVTRLAKLLRELSLGFLGLFLTIFIGVLSIQGVAGAVADGVALRTAKFLTGSFVPVVGRAFSDAIEAVIGTSLLLKNAVSLLGVVVIVVICLLPAVKILSMALVYRLAAAIIQPFGDGNIPNMLENLASVLFTVFGAVAAVGLMFFMVITIVAGLGNYGVLLR